MSSEEMVSFPRAGCSQGKEEPHWMCGAESPRELLHFDSCPRASLPEEAAASRGREKGDAAPSSQAR